MGKRECRLFRFHIIIRFHIITRDGKIYDCITFFLHYIVTFYDFPKIFNFPMLSVIKQIVTYSSSVNKFFGLKFALLLFDALVAFTGVLSAELSPLRASERSSMMSIYNKSMYLTTTKRNSLWLTASNVWFFTRQ